MRITRGYPHVSSQHRTGRNPPTILKEVTGLSTSPFRQSAKFFLGSRFQTHFLSHSLQKWSPVWDPQHSSEKPLSEWEECSVRWSRWDWEHKWVLGSAPTAPWGIPSEFHWGCNDEPAGFAFILLQANNEPSEQQMTSKCVKILSPVCDDIDMYFKLKPGPQLIIT